MDIKRTILAIALSFIVVMGWSYLSVYMGWIEPQQPVAQSTQTEQASSPVQSIATETEQNFVQFQAVEGKEIIIDTPLYTAKLYTGGGILKSFKLKNFAQTIELNSPEVELISQEAATLMPFGLLINGQPSWSLGSWSFEGDNINLQTGENTKIILSAEVEGLSLIREITFFADTYLIDEKIKLASLDNTSRNTRLSYTLAASSFVADNSNYDLMRAGLYSKSLDVYSDNKELSSTGVTEQGKFSFANLMTNYFMMAIAPNTENNLTFKTRIQNGVWRIALENNDIIVPSQSNNQGALIENSWWIGPKDRSLLLEAPNNLSKSIDMGMFSFLAQPMIWLLDFIDQYIGNWGISIIILTIIIRVILMPLTRSSFKSMESMKKIQPMMKQLQEKHKDDKNKLNQEMMQLYKTYKVNPIGGCLPIALQMPVFIALYQGLLNALELRHADFIYYLPFTDLVWLADLSTKDPLYITPVLMGLSMLIQQKMAPAAGDPTQQKMMMLMPIIFTVFFLNFPSGLVLYWLCSNIFSIIQQWFTLRKA